MHSETCWRKQDDCLFFQGRWTHESVSAFWQQLPRSGVVKVNVADVLQFDSAFLTLILQITPPMQQNLIVCGANKAMLSLLNLYNLTSLLTIEVNHYE